jgi:acetyl-CoA carboxylase carboxyl transferase subunit beta
MSILTWIEEKKRLNLLNAPKYINPAKESEQPDLLNDGAPGSAKLSTGRRSSKGLWTRCDKCGVILYIKHLKENQRVCFGCTYHLQMSSQERIENLLDKESWRPFDETVSPCDPLEFHDQKDYTDRLKDAQDKTGLQDAIQTGTGLVDGIPVALGIMDFDFMGGSMGSVVGEKITRLIEYATQEGLTLLLVCASGGARMQEGVFSLMQMAKISSALQIYQSCANLLYISILTSPTTGGVTASFAMLGDIIFAEPKALIAFAGRRVIEQTLCEDLPEDFQTSEYMLHHGLVDLIVPRRFLRQALSESIRLYKNAPFKKPGRIPYGVQNPITFLTEEKLRRQCLSNLSSNSARLEDTPNKNISPNQRKTGPDGAVEVALNENETPSEITVQAISPDKNKTEGPLKGGVPRITESVVNAVEVKRLQRFPYPKETNNPNFDFSEDTEGEVDLIKGKTGFVKGALNNEAGNKGSAKSKSVDKALILAETREGDSKINVEKNEGVLSTKVSATSDTDLQSVPRSGTNERNAISQNFIGDSTFSTFSRESLEYREILTSFQMMYQLFSKQMVKGVTSPKVKGSFTYPFDKGQVKQSFTSQPLPSRKESEDLSLLQKFRELAEGVSVTGSTSATNSGGTESNSSLVGTPSNNHTVPSLLLLKNKNNRDFLNQALELAATESVEWRAFYVHQTISKTTGFLEDFLNPDHLLSTGLLDPTHKGSTLPGQRQNTLFYKSICRTPIG